VVDSTPQSRKYISLNRWQKVVAVKMIVDDAVGDRQAAPICVDRMIVDDVVGDGRQAAPICVDRTSMIGDKREESRW